jgi:hypothetical protein
MLQNFRKKVLKTVKKSKKRKSDPPLSKRSEDPDTGGQAGISGLAGW